MLTLLARRPKGLVTAQIQMLLIKEGILPAGAPKWDDTAELIRVLVLLEEKGKVTAKTDCEITLEDGEVSAISPVHIRWTWVKPKNEGAPA